MIWRLRMLVMNEYEIWCAGWIATGNREQASFIAKSWGIDFKDAVVRYVNTLPEDEQHLYNLDWMKVWGCQLHDNETDARKVYG